jgi:hypothetical protein
LLNASNKIKSGGGHMEINLKNLQEQGFETDYDKARDTISIYPKNRNDITNDLAQLTGLKRRDCYDLQETIHEMQVFDAIRHF